MTRLAIPRRALPPNDITTGNSEVDGVVNSAFGPNAIQKGLNDAIAAGQAGWQTYRGLFGASMPHHKSKNAYSLIAAIKDATEHEGQLTRGLEKECSDELARQTGRDARGFFMPLDVQMSPSLSRRNLTETTGAGSIATQIVPSTFLDVLRARLVVAYLGGQLRNFSDARGRVQIPVKSAASVATWVTDGASAAAESNMTVGAGLLSPKTVTAFTDVSRRMLKSGTPDFLSRIEEDLIGSVAIAVDKAALNGLGTGGQPLGLFQNTGLPQAAIAADSGNGGLPVWADLAAMEEIAGIANADAGNNVSMGWCTSPQGRRVLRKVVQTASGTIPAWCRENGMETLLGYPAAATSNAPSGNTRGTGTVTSLCFGNFRDLLVNLFSPPDLLVNPFRQSVDGNVRVTILQDVDVLIPRSSSFVVAAAILTS